MKNQTTLFGVMTSCKVSKKRKYVHVEFDFGWKVAIGFGWKYKNSGLTAEYSDKIAAIGAAKCLEEHKKLDEVLRAFATSEGISTDFAKWVCKNYGDISYSFDNPAKYTDKCRELIN